MKQYTILDERGNWFAPSMEAARRRGYEVERIKRGREAKLRGLGFIRPHAIPTILQQNHLDYLEMAEHLTMVQDFAQVENYDDKSAQFWRCGKWMPKTWRFDNRDAAMYFLETRAPDILVSKADVGASSKNVRILRNRGDQKAHVRDLFSKGIIVDHCAGGHGSRGATSRQRGYVLFQDYIPHDCTWRVNIVGRGRAMFKRYNGAAGTAETGNVEPVVDYDSALVQAILAFADTIFVSIATKWCALDILHDQRDGSLYLLETSLGWPWPSPGTCDDAPFVGPLEHPYRWRDMWELMLDEYEAGVWAKSSG
jgi:glutathione synthase/RimK-type ligase-like ATP-grasp enzyme